MIYLSDVKSCFETSELSLYKDLIEKNFNHYHNGWENNSENFQAFMWNHGRRYDGISNEDSGKALIGNSIPGLYDKIDKNSLEPQFGEKEPHIRDFMALVSITQNLYDDMDKIATAIGDVNNIISIYEEGSDVIPEKGHSIIYTKIDLKDGRKVEFVHKNPHHLEDDKAHKPYKKYTQFKDGMRSGIGMTEKYWFTHFSLLERDKHRSSDWDEERYKKELKKIKFRDNAREILGKATGLWQDKLSPQQREMKQHIKAAKKAWERNGRALKNFPEDLFVNGVDWTEIHKKVGFKPYQEQTITQETVQSSNSFFTSQKIELEFSESAYMTTHKSIETKISTVKLKNAKFSFN